MKNILTLFLAAVLITGCGGDKKSQEDNAQQQDGSPVVRMPLGENETAPDPSADAIKPVENISEDKLPDLSKLSAIEKSIFKKTVSIQVPYYDALEKWADRANELKTGTEAAKSLRSYIKLQEDFARQMQGLDDEFAGKIDVNYTGSEDFQKVLEQYMGDPELMRRTEYIMRSYMGVIQRFKDDPACKDVFSDIEKMARQAQGAGQ